MVQYRSFLTGLFRGDLGRSLYEQSSVTDLIRARLPATIELTLCAMAMAVIISFPLATLAAVKKGSGIDRGALLFSLLGLSVPNFWLGPLLMIIFSIQLGWTPVSGRDGLDHLVLPSLTLGMGMAAILTRILRGSLLQVSSEDYVRSARAKGLSEKQVWLNILCNALLSVITIMSLQFGSLLAGSIITETVFSLARYRAVDRAGNPDPRLSFGPRLRAGHRYFIPIGKSPHGYLLSAGRPENHLWKVSAGSTLVWLS